MRNQPNVRSIQSFVGHRLTSESVLLRSVELGIEGEVDTVHIYQTKNDLSLCSSSECAQNLSLGLNCWDAEQSQCSDIDAAHIDKKLCICQGPQLDLHLERPNYFMCPSQEASI